MNASNLLCLLALSCTATWDQVSNAGPMPCETDSVVFDGSALTGPPPGMLGPYQMAPFPLDSPCPPAMVASVPVPGGGQLTFSQELRHSSVAGGAPSACQSIALWSHGYTGDAYDVFMFSPPIVIALPPGTKAFYFYVVGSAGGAYPFTAAADGGASSGTVTIHSASGGRYFGFYATGSSTLSSITISNPGGASGGFHVGEFGIARSGCGVCMADLNDDGFVNGLDLAGLLAQWTGAATGSPCPPTQEADLNGDCSVNGVDLAALLASWGPC